MIIPESLAHREGGGGQRETTIGAGAEEHDKQMSLECRLGSYNRSKRKTMSPVEVTGHKFGVPIKPFVRSI